MAIITVGNGTTGGGGGAVTQLFASVLSSTAASIDFQSIDQSYNHLQLICVLRTDYNGFSFDTFGIRFNNDSTTNHYQWVMGDNANTRNLGTSMQCRCACVGDSTAADFTHANLWVPMYCTGSTANKLCFGNGSDIRDHSGSLIFVNSFTGQWFSTATINRITLIPIGGSNFVAGSAVYLYGIT